MHDDNFEKEVQKKLAELKLRPEESVWTRVEEQLQRKDKRRRRVIWLPVLFLSAALLGGYMLLVDNGHDKPPAANSNQLTAGENKNQRQLPPVTHRGNDPADNTNPSPGNRRSNTPHLPGHITADPDPLALPKTAASAVTEKEQLPQSSRRHQLIVRSATGRKNRSFLTSAEPAVSFTYPDSKEPPIASDGTMSGEKTAREPLPSLGMHTGIPPGSVNVFRTIPADQVSPAVIPPKISRRQTKDWSWGFTVEAGRSSINNGKLKSLLVSEAVADVNSAYTPALFGNFYLPPSDLKPGVGLTAGVIFEKELRRNIALAVGLNYSNLSTSHKVGGRVDSSMVLRTAMIAGDKAVDAFYKLGSSANYRNTYHFVELPVSVVIKMLPYSKMPVNYNLGLSVARLVSSNALHFDGNAHIYYRDNSLFNKTQFNLTTGLNVRLAGQRSYDVTAGPQLQYGITNLLKGERADGKHLLLIGLKANILFR